jgi:hypothetical protein
MSEERECVMVQRGLDLNVSTCHLNSSTTDDQRAASGLNVTTLICSLPAGHPGARHYDGVDNITWMFHQEWSDESGDAGAIDGTPDPEDEEDEPEEEENDDTPVITISERRDRPNPGLVIEYTEAPDD